MEDFFNRLITVGDSVALFHGPKLLYIDQEMIFEMKCVEGKQCIENSAMFAETSLLKDLELDICKVEQCTDCCNWFIAGELCVCTDCGEPVCTDCQQPFSFHHQIDYPLHKSCFESRLDAERL